MKDKITQITGTGNFALYKSGKVTPLGLCANSVTGNHRFVDVKDTHPFFHSCKRETITTRRFGGLIPGEERVYHMWLYHVHSECDFCRMVDDKKGEWVEIEKEVSTERTGIEDRS